MGETRYFAVECKCGHVGRDRFMRVTFYVSASDGKEAAAKARYFPRVKHDHKDCILSVTRITKEEFIAGLNVNRQDEYLHVKNVQEQRKAAGLYERTEAEQIKPESRKAKSGKRLSERNPKRFQKMQGYPEADEGFDLYYPDCA